MRDLTEQLLRLDRGKRRMALTILLLSTTPAPAGSPGSSADSIRSNPFFESASPGQLESVQLASGNNQSTIRLKPIGKAIGLKTVQRSDSAPPLPQDVGGAKIKIEHVPSVVRTNPLIDSIHHADRQLVDTEVTDPVPSNQPAGTSTIVLRPVRRHRPVQQPPLIIDAKPRQEIAVDRKSPGHLRQPEQRSKAPGIPNKADRVPGAAVTVANSTVAHGNLDRWPRYGGKQG